MSEWKYLFPNLENDEDYKVIEPCLHKKKVIEARQDFLKLLDSWYHTSEENKQMIFNIADFLNMFIVPIDDMQDDSELRRGEPATHLVHGIPATLNAAKFVEFTMYEKNFAEDVKLVELIATKLMEVFKGQGIEIYWRDNFICPTEEEYKWMVIKKTGTLVDLTIELFQFGNKNYSFDIADFSHYITIYLQVKDDYLNLTSEKVAKKKNFCDDIGEGKFGFPMIHAIQSKPEDDRLLNILKRKPKDFETKNMALNLLVELGSLDYTKKVIANLEKKLRECLRQMPENATAKVIFGKEWPS